MCAIRRVCHRPYVSYIPGLVHASKPHFFALMTDSLGM